MVTKKYQELLDLDLMVADLYSKNPDLVNTKFGWGYKRFFNKNLKEIFSDYNQELSNIRIENAQVDEKTKTILTSHEGRGFQYSKEGLKKVIEDERKLEKEWSGKDFEAEPYFIDTKNLPENLNEYQLELMKGLIVE